MLAAALPGLLANDLSTGTERLSWVLPPLLLVTASTTFSQVGVGPQVVASGLPLGKSVGLVLGNTAFRRLLGVFIVNGIAAALPATLFLFFVADVLGAANASGTLLALYFIAGAASLPVWVRLAARYGRVRAWALAMVLAVGAFASAAFLGSGDIAAFAVICLASGLALGADLALPAAIAAGLALPLLDLLNYRPGGANGLEALRFAYALLPLGFKLLAAALLWRWRDSLEIGS